MRFQFVCYTVGLLLVALGVMMLLPAAVDYAAGGSSARVFMYCAALCYFFGGLMCLAFRSPFVTISVRDGFLLTVVSWTVLCFFAALPYYFSDLQIGLAGSFFESVSGFTTTGSTVIVGLDTTSPGILIWRSTTNFIGGIGFIVFAIVILPFLNVGGMQLFRTESSDRYDKALPRTKDIMKSLLIVYCGLIAACAVVYDLLGMTTFDAINHAIPTIATGGFSTHDSSFGFFNNPALDITAVVFMLLGGMPFVLFVKALFARKFDLFVDEQVRGFLKFVAVVIGVLSLWLWMNSEYNLLQSLRYVSFSVVSIITTTGFATTDYTLWGSFAVTVFLFLTYLGACSGSTSGGIKFVRLLIAAAVMRKQLATLVYPHGVFTIRFQGRPVPPGIIGDIMGFLCLYVVMNVVLTFALALTGLDFITSLSGAATALANVGPGLGPIIGPAGNFSTLPDSAKWLLSAGMLLGRLEIMTIMVIAVPLFWKK